MNCTIRLAGKHNIDEIELLYHSLIEHLENTINYPKWKKGVYPTRQVAMAGINEKCLYVAEHNGKIAGTFILRHKPERGYDGVIWQEELCYDNVFVIYTFAVHPHFWGQGVGQKLLQFAVEEGVKTNVRSIRLDVYENNLPAIRLYEKFGFQYIDTVDLGMESYGVKWFKLYEKIIYRR